MHLQSSIPPYHIWKRFGDVVGNIYHQSTLAEAIKSDARTSVSPMESRTCFCKTFGMGSRAHRKSSIEISQNSPESGKNRNLEDGKTVSAIVYGERSEVMRSKVIYSSYGCVSLRGADNTNRYLRRMP